ncbi:hypothetical protein [Paraburkholderia azotifigens]|uniref:Uncharacterized protein n=1 Tax=Paraburkholderia azotifigens TaxID=2057004 RepID=A0A5C6VDE1_9BURK|nr:hypothetical protein [Paraburkholderia azotifigens]TXC82804.1 hypothetical protein FRZ40_20440 [Paraburkholderia azotifigens]
MFTLPTVFRFITPRHSLVAVAVLSIVVLCATGVAAFAGLLPASDHVATAITATPFVDIQVGAATSAE